MKYYGLSDIGKQRETNQDSYIIVTNKVNDVFALVCDGIGGGKSGDIASSTTTNFIAEAFVEHEGFASCEEVKSWLKKIILKVNDHVFALSTTDKKYDGMGTTLVGVLISDKGNFVVNVGDSRAYYYNKEDGLVTITEDHNMAMELYRRELIKKEEIETHPQRNILTNAVGVVGNIRVDILPIEKKGKTIMLSTDGLHGYVSEAEIKEVMGKKASLQKKAKELIALANEGGGFDNTTIILIELKEGE